MKWNDWDIVVGDGEIFIGLSMCAVGLEFPGTELVIGGAFHIWEHLYEPTWVYE